MDNKQTINVSWALTGGPRVQAGSSLPACGRVLNQPLPLLFQLGQDCHPSLAWEGCGRQEQTQKAVETPSVRV